MLYLPDKDEFMKNYPDTRAGRRDANREYKKLEIKQKEAAKARKKTFAGQVEQQRQDRKESGGFGAAGVPGPRMYPQELFSASQPNGIHFYINARSNSAAAISQGQAGQLPDQDLSLIHISEPTRPY